LLEEFANIGHLFRWFAQQLNIGHLRRFRERKAIFMMKGYFNRDRFLEVTAMMKDELMVSLYPRLSFDSGQRYISNGCYIVSSCHAINKGFPV
jgi:hypothetical protein